MAQHVLDPSGMDVWHRARKLDAALWGVFFIWVGIAMLTGVSWGVALIGIGVIMLGGQSARRTLGLELEGFWVVVGVLLLLGGVWSLLSVEIALIPFVLIVAGIALLVSAVRTRKP